MEKLELGITREAFNPQVSPTVPVDAAEPTDPLSDAMSNLKLQDVPAEESSKSQSAALEAA